MSQKLYQFAVLYHPKPTKDQIETGDYPKSQIVVDLTTKLGGSEQEVAMIAARAIPSEYAEKLENLEVLVRPF